MKRIERSSPANGCRAARQDNRSIKSIVNLSIPGTRARESFNLQAHIPDFKKHASPKDGNSADFRRFYWFLSQILHAFFMVMRRRNLCRMGIPDRLSGKI